VFIGLRKKEVGLAGSSNPPYPVRVKQKGGRRCGPTFYPTNGLGGKKRRVPSTNIPPFVPGGEEGAMGFSFSLFLKKRRGARYVLKLDPFFEIRHSPLKREGKKCADFRFDPEGGKGMQAAPLVRGEKEGGGNHWATVNHFYAEMALRMMVRGGRGGRKDSHKKPFSNDLVGRRRRKKVGHETSAYLIFFAHGKKKRERKKGRLSPFDRGVKKKDRPSDLFLSFEARAQGKGETPERLTFSSGFRTRGGEKRGSPHPYKSRLF